MKRKSILAFALVAMLGSSVMLTGCGSSTTNKNAIDNGNNATDKLEDSANKAGDAVKDGAESIKNGVEGVGDAIKYTAIDVKDDFVKAGYNVKESTDTFKNYFTGKETDYYTGNELVRVYEYDNSADLEADINKISADGLVVNGTSVYSTKPYYYRKGNALIIYEGTNSSYVKQFNTMYGNTLIP